MPSPLLVGQIAEYYLGGHGGIGVYQTFTHVDTRTARARWDQRSGREVAVSGWPRLAGPKEETVMDNISSAYAEEAVAWAVENGLLQGNRGGEPDALPARHPAAAGSGVVPLCKAGGADLIHY